MSFWVDLKKAACYSLLGIADGQRVADVGSSTCTFDSENEEFV
jgi:hypothetical protein